MLDGIKKRFRERKFWTPIVFFALLGAIVFPVLSCSDSSRSKKSPNVLFVVWDTVRADRMSLYGYERPTTPFLEEWAKDAQVFENCISTGSSTVPSHGSMFTGLLPSEHGANNLFMNLDDQHVTLAEIFQQQEYQTYLFSANPLVSSELNFCQGFDVAEHPWDKKYQSQAMRILGRKIDPRDTSSELPQKIRSNQVSIWDIKACGKQAQRGLLSWLEKRDPSRPFFAFLNYMEAHRPFIPPEKYRRKVMTPEQVERSYRADRSWVTMRRYTFGFHEYSPEDLEIMASVYDACIAELDDHFKNLILALEGKGLLDNTIVVLTSDHGEHLGEHHLLDHRYSLYEGLVKVPLLLYFPSKIEPKRVNLPVVNFDLFFTLLDLAGIEQALGSPQHTESLLSPPINRKRIAEYPTNFEEPISTIRTLYPTWDPTPFRRRLTALYQGKLKLIWASDGSHELYDLLRDPGESDNISATAPDDMQRMLAMLQKVVRNLNHYNYDKAKAPQLSQKQRQRLQALGYMDGGRKADERDQ